MIYGIFQWVFLALAFICGISALVRIESYSTHSTQRVHHHSDQQAVLWILTTVFAVAGFVAAVLAVRHGLR
ncbi:hypothetical protein CVV68_00175 [Arthrobacter livingstonensis]|uniref:Uncharacterized protein n=1 Tax=Arthrobacter livingstonensis TaxID=670078 RepID=A0A2V5LD10_9MICC|nr:hypothetical protein [Arthrobacter livingstonensis]PYI69571.1 hypothetical protein CVV68_00175 [Arthrobacter livingstonensis]